MGSVCQAPATTNEEEVTCPDPATTVATTEKEKMKGMNTFYFTYPFEGNLKNSIVSYSEANGIIVLSVDLDMVKWHSI